MAYLRNESNGYLQQKKINRTNFTLMYRPTDMMVLQNMDDSIDFKKIKIYEQKYKHYLYFNLSMSMNNKDLLSVVPNNDNEFAAMTNQLVFGMKGKVHLYTQTKDTIGMVDYVYPRMYGMSHSTSMLFIYPRDEKRLTGNYLNFTIEDIGLNTGEVHFRIPIKLLKKEPKLSL